MKIFLRNKPIRRPGATSMGFLVCAAVMDDSSTGGIRIKKRLEPDAGSLDWESRKTSKRRSRTIQGNVCV